MTEKFHDHDTMCRVGFEPPNRRGSYQPRGQVIFIRAGSLKEAIDLACQQHPDLTPVEARAIHERWVGNPFSNPWPRRGESKQ